MKSSDILNAIGHGHGTAAKKAIEHIKGISERPTIVIFHEGLQPQPTIHPGQRLLSTYPVDTVSDEIG